MQSAVGSSTDRYSQAFPPPHEFFGSCLQLGTQPQPLSVFTHGTSPTQAFRSGNSFSTHGGAQPPWTHRSKPMQDTDGSPAWSGSQGAPACRMPSATQPRTGLPREVRVTTRQSCGRGQSSFFAQSDPRHCVRPLSRSTEQYWPAGQLESSRQAPHENPPSASGAHSAGGACSEAVVAVQRWGWRLALAVSSFESLLPALFSLCDTIRRTAASAAT